MRKVLWTGLWPILFVVLACGGGGGEDDTRGGLDGRPADAALDATVDVPVDQRPGDDAETVTEPAEPTLTLVASRVGDETAYPPVRLTVTVTDAEGAPWEGDVTVTAQGLAEGFAPTLGEVEMKAPGQYEAVLFADRSGEVAVMAEAEVAGSKLYGTQNVLFLPYVHPDWGVPRAVSSVNITGSEDSLSISPDGRTLFFTYTPMKGCNYMPAGWGDEPDKPECVTPAGEELGSIVRPCDHGLAGDGTVSPGLFGVEESWPWPKALMNSYAATRQENGAFAPPVCISFDDDGTIMEVSPTSGPENPVPGEPYNFFFAYPDWLDLDTEHDGSLFAVATIPAGQTVALSDPITEASNPPDNVLARTLTGPMNQVREESAQVGEFRVFWNPQTANHELWFERRATEDDSMEIVMSPLLGEYPDGDWGAAEPVPGAVNTDTHDQGFPWPVVLEDELHLFFNRGNLGGVPGNLQVLDSVWTGTEWGDPEPVLEAGGGLAGEVLILALPSVSVGDFGTEMFFIYVLTYPDDLEFQVGVIARR